MVDTKIKDLPLKSTLDTTDEFVINDVAGANVDKKVTLQGILNARGDIGCHITKSADQSVADITFTTITWNTEEYDTDTMHDNVTNNSRITIKTAGKYIFNVGFDWTEDFTVNTRFALRLMKNGTTEMMRVDFTNAITPNSGANLNLTHVDNFALNDYIEAEIYQDSDGAKSINALGGTFPAHFVAQKIDRGG